MHTNTEQECEKEQNANTHGRRGSCKTHMVARRNARSRESGAPAWNRPMPPLHEKSRYNARKCERRGTLLPRMLSARDPLSDVSVSRGAWAPKWCGGASAAAATLPVDGEGERRRDRCAPRAAAPPSAATGSPSGEVARWRSSSASASRARSASSAVGLGHEATAGGPMRGGSLAIDGSFQKMHACFRSRAYTRTHAPVHLWVSVCVHVRVGLFVFLFCVRVCVCLCVCVRVCHCLCLCVSNFGPRTL